MNKKAPLAVGAVLAASLMASEARGEIKGGICPDSCTAAQTETLNRIHEVLGVDLLTNKNGTMLQVTPDDRDDKSAVQIPEDGSVQLCQFVDKVRLLCKNSTMPADEFLELIAEEDGVNI